MEKIEIAAYNVAKEIDLYRLSKRILGKGFRRSWEKPLVIEFKGRTVYFYSFGSFVLIDPYKGMAQDVIDQLRDYVRRLLPPITEKYEIIKCRDTREFEKALKDTGFKQEHKYNLVATERACIVTDDMFNRNTLEIISFVLAQSVALERLERDVDDALEKADRILSVFEKRGALFRVKSTIRELTHVLKIRLEAISDIMVLEKPEITWENPELEELYEQLRSIYEIEERFDNLDRSIEEVLQMGEILSDLVTASRETMLEILIIALIIIEILITIVEYIMP